MSHVSVIEFNRHCGIYQVGDRAGFEPEVAAAYVAKGFARTVHASVPRVDPSVVASDAKRRIDEARAMIAHAEREAQGAGKVPSAAETAADALASAAEARKMLAGLERQLNAAGDLSAPDSSRKAPASARAS